MWEIIKKEIKEGILSHPIKLIRYLGVLFIPFLYGFVYIFAFFNPIDKTADLDFAVIASKNTSEKNKGILKEVFQNKNLSIKPQLIYMDIKNKSFLKKEISKHYSSVVINPILKNENGKEVEVSLIENFKNNLINIKNKDDLTSFIKKTFSPNGKPLIEFHVNYKKSFLLGFGISAKSHSIATFDNIISSFFKINPESISNLISPKNNVDLQKIKSLWSQFNEYINKKHGIFNYVSEKVHEHNEYGFGLSPFFISMALWVGSLSLSLFIHGKTYEPKFSKIKTFFAKLIIFWISNIIQSVILIASLSIIGFSALGINLFYLFLTSLFISFIFSSIVHSIRLAIPNRVVGIMMVIFILIFQMGSSSGLFPSISQNAFYKAIHYILPMTFSVNALRESMINTDAIYLFSNLGILLIFPIPFIAASSLIYSKRKNILNKEGGVNV